MQIRPIPLASRCVCAPPAGGLAGLSLRPAAYGHSLLCRHKYDVNASLTCLRFLASGFAYAKRTLPSLKRGSRSDGSRSHHLVWRRDQSDRGGVPELLVFLFPTAVRLTRTYAELCHVVATIPAHSRGWGERE